MAYTESLHDKDELTLLQYVLRILSKPTVLSHDDRTELDQIDAEFRRRDDVATAPHAPHAPHSSFDDPHVEGVTGL